MATVFHKGGLALATIALALVLFMGVPRLFDKPHAAEAAPFPTRCYVTLVYTAAGAVVVAYIPDFGQFYALSVAVAWGWCLTPPGPAIYGQWTVDPGPCYNFPTDPNCQGPFGGGGGGSW